MSEYEHKQTFDERYRYLKRRLTMLRVWTGVIVVAAFLLACVMDTYLSMSSKFNSAVPFAVGVLGVVILGKKKGPIKEEIETMKSYAAGAILEQKLSALTVYDPFSAIGSDVVGWLNLPMGCDRISGSDLVEGSWRGVPVRFSDVRLVTVYNDDTEQTTFKGQMFALGMKRKIQGRVWIGKVPLLRKRGYAKHFGLEIEDAAALARQNVFASSQEAADAVLTGVYASRLRDAFNRANDKLYLCFDGDTLYGALNSKRDLFEGGGDQEWDALVSRGSQELDELLGLIDCLTDAPDLFDRTKAA